MCWVSLVVRVQNQDTLTMLGSHPQLLKFQPTPGIQLGPGSGSFHQCQVTLTLSPGAVQEDGALPMLGLHLIPWGQKREGACDTHRSCHCHALQLSDYLCHQNLP
jgi:hypothetical protein